MESDKRAAGGDYRFSTRWARLYRNSSQLEDDWAAAKSQRIANATKKFTIPEIPGGRSDEPFDLGGHPARAREDVGRR